MSYVSDHLVRQCFPENGLVNRSLWSENTFEENDFPDFDGLNGVVAIGLHGFKKPGFVLDMFDAA